MKKIIVTLLVAVLALSGVAYAGNCGNQQVVQRFVQGDVCHQNVISQQIVAPHRALIVSEVYPQNVIVRQQVQQKVVQQNVVQKQIVRRPNLVERLANLVGAVRENNTRNVVVQKQVVRNHH